MKVLPHAPFEVICTAPEAEMVKYAGNFFLYLKVLYANLMYETAEAIGADYTVVSKAIAADPRIGGSHLSVLHDSGHNGAKRGRGAGGVCFIKDVEALAEFYADNVGEKYGEKLFAAATNKNIDLLVKSNKDIDLVIGVHGQGVLKHHKK
jgi:UDP-glucose 6-dehydrogenase